MNRLIAVIGLAAVLLPLSGAAAEESAAPDGAELLQSVSATMTENNRQLGDTIFEYSVLSLDLTITEPKTITLSPQADRDPVTIVQRPREEWTERIWVSGGPGPGRYRNEHRSADGTLFQVVAYDGDIWRIWRPDEGWLKVDREGHLLPSLLDPRLPGAFDARRGVISQLKAGKVIAAERYETNGLVRLTSRQSSDAAFAQDLQVDFHQAFGLLPVRLQTFRNGLLADEARISYQPAPSGGFVPKQLEYWFFVSGPVTDGAATGAGKMGMGEIVDTAEPTHRTIYRLTKIEAGVLRSKSFFQIADVPPGTEILDPRTFKPPVTSLRPME